MAGNQKITVTLEVEAQITKAQQALKQLSNSMQSANINPFAGTFDKLANKLDNLRARAADPMDLAGVKSWSKDVSAVSVEIETLSQKIIDLQNSSDEKKLKIFGSNIDANIKTATKSVKEYFQTITEGESRQAELQDKINQLTNDSEKHYTKGTANVQLSKLNKSYEAIKNQLLKVNEAQNKFNKDKSSANLKILDTQKTKLQALIQKYNQLANIEKELKTISEGTKLTSGADQYHLENQQAITQRLEKASQLRIALAKAREELKQLDMTDLKTQSFDKLKAALQSIGIEITQDGQEINWTKQQWQEFFTALRTGEINKINQILNEAGISTRQFKNEMTGLRGEAERTQATLTETGEGISYIQNQLKYLTGLTGTIMVLRRALSQTISTIKELDETMTETAVVTKYTVSEMWDQLPTYAEKAKELGMSINDVYEASTLYYQQGLNSNQVTQITTQTLKMARIAGLEAAEATDRMTAALRGFNKEINETEATNIADVYSKLAAITASDVDEISTAMSKVASLAYSANMSFENTAAFLAQIIETTRESAETAGTALKTVIARFAEIKENPAITTDSEGEEISYNKIDEALQSVGISLEKFMAGEEGLDEVFMRLSEKWDTLDTKMQRYIATQAAGSRQQSRFIALMQNYSRMVELTGAAYNSAGASAEQYAKTEESLETKLANLKTEWQTFLMTIVDSDLIKGFITALTELLELINKITDSNGLAKFGVLVSSLMVIRPILMAITTSLGSLFTTQHISLIEALGVEFGKLGTTLTNVGIGAASAETGLATLESTASATSVSLGALFGYAMIAVVALTKVCQALHSVTAEGRSEQLDEAQEKLNETNVELEETESQLLEIEERITEINESGPLSLVETDELNKLKEEREELQILYNTLKATQELQQQETNKDALKYVKASLQELTIIDEQFTGGDNDQFATVYTEALEGILDIDQSTLSDEDKETYDALLRQISKVGLEKGLMSGTDYVSSYLSNWEQESIEGMFKYLANEFTTQNGGKLSLEDVKKVLNTDTLKKGYSTYLKAFGNDETKLLNHIKSYKQEVEAETESTYSFTGMLESLSSLEDSFDALDSAYQEFNSDGRIAASTLLELQESFASINSTTLLDLLEQLQNADDETEVRDILNQIETAYFNAMVSNGKITAENIAQYEAQLAIFGIQVDTQKLEEKSLEYNSLLLQLKEKQAEVDNIKNDNALENWQKQLALLDLEPELQAIQEQVDNFVWGTKKVELKYTTDDDTNAQEEFQQAWIDLINQIAEYWVNSQQQQIDMEQEELDAINEAQNNITNSIETNINRIRQDRKNQDSEQNISNLTRRLAYLRQDTSGSNALEIKQLEEELAEATEDYSDDLIDQSLDDLKESQEAAIEQRQEQIDIQKSILDWQEDNGVDKTEAERILRATLNGDNTELKKLFTANTLQLSELEASQKWTDITDAIDTISSGINTWSTTIWNAIKPDDTTDKHSTNSGSSDDTTNTTATTDAVEVSTQGSSTSNRLSIDLIKQAQTLLNDTSASASDMKIQLANLLGIDGTDFMAAANEAQAEGRTSDAGVIRNIRELYLKKYNLDDNGQPIANLITNALNLNNPIRQNSTNTTSKENLENAISNGLTDHVISQNTTDDIWSAYTNSTEKKTINGTTYVKVGKYWYDENEAKQLGGLGVTRYKIIKYANGGLVSNTGPAWLDGTTTNPEVVLNARDSANFIELRDILRNVSGNLGNTGSYSFDININVDELANDYDVDSLANRIKTDIVSAMSYRNNNFAGSLR